MATSTHSTAPVTPIMVMGCTKTVITYRAQGQETICLQSAPHGVQQLVGFNPANGDVLGLNDILETTLAHADLSDVARYITSTVSAAGTTLYIDPTGHGLQGSAFAVLQGVQTTVAQLVANGGMKYVPDPVALTATFNTPFTFRPDGLETVNLLAPVSGIGPQQINGFDPAKGDVLQLGGVLNNTLALPDLSDIQNYVTATIVNGNTILSVDRTGGGHAGIAFAQLNGVAITLPQLVADHALVLPASTYAADARWDSTFVFRSEGNEIAWIQPAGVHNAAPPQLQGFSLAAGDSLCIRNILLAANLSVAAAALPNYFSTTQSNGSTLLWFNPAGSGNGGSVVAVLQNTLVTMSDLLSAGALKPGQPITPTTPLPVDPLAPIMVMGCASNLITYRAQGQETICLQSAPHGVQQLAGFNAAKGDVIGLNDILETTLAHADLSDVARYITSTVSAAGTTLYLDPTGHGLKGSAFAVLQGVQTTVAQLVANGGMKYIPDPVALTATFNTPFTFRPDGLETVNLLAPAPGSAPQQINGFDPAKGDVLQLGAVLNATLALPDLSDLQKYVTATVVNGNTILSVDPTGGGHAGVAFAQLNGVAMTLSQLQADHALLFTPTHLVAGATAGQLFQFRSEGNEARRAAQLHGRHRHSHHRGLRRGRSDRTR